MIENHSMIISNLHKSEMSLKWDWKSGKFKSREKTKIEGKDQKKNKFQEENTRMSTTKGSCYNDTLNSIKGQRKLINELKSLEKFQKEVQKLTNKNLVLRNKSIILYDMLKNLIENSKKKSCIDCFFKNKEKNEIKELEEKFYIFSLKLEKEFRKVIQELRAKNIMKKFERRKKERREKLKTIDICGEKNSSYYDQNYNRILINEIRKKIFLKNNENDNRNFDFEDSFDIFDNLEIEIMANEEEIDFEYFSFKIQNFEISMKLKQKNILDSEYCVTETAKDFEEVDSRSIRPSKKNPDFTFYSPQMDKSTSFNLKSSYTESKYLDYKNENEEFLLLLEPLDNDSDNSRAISEFSLK